MTDQTQTPDPSRQALVELYKDLGQFKWHGLDSGWNLAIKAVRKELRERIRGTAEIGREHE